MQSTASPPEGAKANINASTLSSLGSSPSPAHASAKALSPKGSPAGGSTSASAAKKKNAGRSSGSATGVDYVHQRQLLQQCDWKELTLWSARQIIGGNAVNGFLRSTATAQRIKKQRARQTKHSSSKASSSPGSGPAEKKPGVPATAGFDQAAEERLKKEIMNPRTAKKIKAEFEAGVDYCVAVHDLLRRVLLAVDPQQQIFLPPPLGKESLVAGGFNPRVAAVQAQGALFPSLIPPPVAGVQISPNVGGHGPVPISSRATSAGENTTLSPGTPSGSTLRKMRKKKIHVDPDPVPGLSEFDDTGKRIYSKKDHQNRVFEALRFRPLKQGDFVAARVTSRDLWILARVLKDYDGCSMGPNEFLLLTEAKRDALFRNKVIIKDVEEKEDVSNAVSRSLILPLPRNYSEASEWGQR
jgi:hypothetical protein